MTEKEMFIEINDFFGVSRQVLPEGLPKGYFHTLQNVYERKFKELQRRGGSSSLSLSLPSNVTAVDNIFYLKQRGGEKRRLCAISTTSPSGASLFSEITAKVTPSFTTVTGGQFGTSVAGNFYRDSSYYLSSGAQYERAIMLQFVGYGINYTVVWGLSGIGGIADGGSSFGAGPSSAGTGVRVAISSALNSNITGINVYVGTRCNNGGGLGNSSTWIGFIDLLTTATGNFDFSQAPATLISGTSGATAINYGGGNPTFSLSGGTGGTLTPGKTYYVAVLGQLLQSSATAERNTSGWFRTSVTTIASITLGLDQNRIVVSNISGDSPCYLIAVGENEQLLQPQFITNTVGTNNINSMAPNNPNVIDINHTSSSAKTLAFAGADVSIDDMLIRYTDAGIVRPVFVSRLTDFNRLTQTSGEYNAQAPVMYPFRQQALPFGDGSRYCYAQLGDVALFVNDYFGNLDLTISGFGASVDISERYQSGYFVTDGFIAASVVFDYDTSPVPKSKFIATFQESIVVGGGSLGSESYNKIFISNAQNFANFSRTGSGADLAFIAVEAGGEPITGIGTYSINTSDSGPKTEFLVGKRTKTFKINSIPTSYDGAYMDTLSGRIGLANHFTLVQTDIGTIFAGLDGVYLVRDTGEPQAIGEDIRDILKNEDPTVGINSSFWSACYHDGMYKLAYSPDGTAAPTRELWLNVKKMIANKGQPVWYGPHVGRTINYQICDVEFVDGDRAERICVDVANDRIFKADRPDYSTDFSSNIATVIELVDTAGDGGLFANKKMVRGYLKGRVNYPINMATTISSDGSDVEIIDVPMVPATAGTTYNSFLSQVTRVFTFFPSGRVRGRLLKLKFAYSGAVFFAISGIVLSVRPERRRI
jgi:hypothetical protein